MPQAPARRAASESSDVANLVRLHHRRRGWAWVAIGSAIGLAVFVGIDVNLFQNLTGSAETLSVIPVFVLLALVLAGRHRAAFGCRRDDPPLTGACLYAKSQVSPALQ
jgi:Mn2+/Fe2+ NRAMP family transporter